VSARGLSSRLTWEPRNLIRDQHDVAAVHVPGPVRRVGGADRPHPGAAGKVGLKGEPTNQPARAGLALERLRIGIATGHQRESTQPRRQQRQLTHVTPIAEHGHDRTTASPQKSDHKAERLEPAPVNEDVRMVDGDCPPAVGGDVPAQVDRQEIDAFRCQPVQSGGALRRGLLEDEDDRWG
jgi:hypothetical protein